MARSQLMTLLTDFGTRDAYVAAMKGAILNVCRNAQIVDIVHDLPSHDILAASFVLAQAAPAFPAGTLHVAVVDPGVGTQRAILAGEFGGQTFLFPDNGLITFVAQMMPMSSLYSVRNPRYMPQAGVSMTFHGRDVFAPIAGEILNGLDLRRLGPTPESFKLLDIPVPQATTEQISGQIIYVDRFGNLVSNISQNMLASFSEFDRLEVSCGGRRIGRLSGTYAFVAAGELTAIINSAGLVEVAVNQGRASEALGQGVGAQVSVRRV